VTGGRAVVGPRYVVRTLEVCLTLALVCLCVAAPGSDRTVTQYVHTAWGQKEGAPGGIFALAQTADGFLWLGSVDGLYRFDGVTFELRRPGIVYALLALPNGDLWIGRRSAISLLRNGQTTDYTVGDGVPDGKVASFAEDSEGTMWVATNAGLARLKSNHWERVGADWNFHEAYATGMLLDRQGTFWVAAGHTILYLPHGSRRFQTTGITTTQVWTVVEAPNGKLWMSETSRSVRPVPLGRNLPPSDKTEIVLGSIAILFDREGSLWISSIGDGMRRVPFPERMDGRRFEKQDSSIERFTVADGLTDNLVTAILEDREGNIWVGTNNGLDRFYKGKLVPIVLPFPVVQPVMVPGDHGSIWVDSMGHAFHIMSSGEIAVTSKGHGYLDAYRGPDGAVWWQAVGFLDRDEPGSAYWSRSRRIRVPSDPTTKVHQALKVTEDRNGVIWGASESAGVFSFSNDHWKQIDGMAVPQGYRGSAAFTDWAGRIWLGFQDGTLILLEDGRVLRNWSGRTSAVGHNVSSIAGRGRHIWLSGEKLVFFDGENFYEVTPVDGTHFKVWGIVETQDGSLWLCENRGVVSISSSEVARFLENHDHRVQYQIYDVLDGLPGSFHDAAPRTREIQGTDGRLWFSSTKGIAWLDPATLPTNMLPPPVSIRSMKADGKDYSASGVRIPPLATSLEIDYTALSLSIPERVRFRYRLDGVDKNWQDAGTRRAAFYTMLGPGKYHFRVSACNSDGIWNEEGAHLDFSIAPTFYQTTWFHALWAAAFLALLWAFYQMRLHQLRQQFSIKLEERVSERTRIARELHDTLLQSFHGLMFQFQAARNLLTRSPESAMQAMDEAILATEQAIAEGRDAIRDLRPEPAAQHDLAELLTAAGEELADAQSENGHVPRFRVVVEGQPQKLSPTLQDEIYRIGREVIRNAFHHAVATRVEVEVRYGDHQLRLRIRDDGKGIDPEVLAARGRPGHWGLPGIRERAERIGARLEFWSESGVGTEVELSVPAAMAFEKQRNGHRSRLFHWGGSNGGRS
jgi:signal transduction histidine kinase/ligand-binding sensor domain-containing protein